MKTLYLIGGTMGVGKTTVSQQLKKDLINSVFLDGDWCWDASPFQVTEETKEMVLNNICYLLNNFWEPLEEVVLSGRYNVQKSGYPGCSYQSSNLTFRLGETGIALLYFLLQEKFEHGEIFGKNQQ